MNACSANLSIVARKSGPDPVAEYAVMRVNQWVKAAHPSEKRTLKSWAVAHGLSPSHPTQWAGGLGVGRKVLPRVASAFDMTEAELIGAAHKWWAETGHQLVRAAQAAHDDPFPERAQAVQVARGLGVSEDVIRFVLDAYGGSVYAERDTLWWVTRFGLENQERRQTALLKAAEDKAIDRYHRKVGETRQEGADATKELDRAKSEARRKAKKRRAS